MWRARPSNILPLIALIGAAVHSARPTEDTTRQQMEQAEHAHAAEQAARQQAARRAAIAAAAAQRLTAERIATAARLREAETATAKAAARIDELAAEQRQALSNLNARTETMQPLLPLIERLSLFPAETLLAVPGPPEETLRGVLVLRGLADQLGQEAMTLRHKRARLAAASEALQVEASRLATARTKQQAEAAMLDQQIAAAEAGRMEAESDTSAAADRAEKAAARAETLRGMLFELQARRQEEAAHAREEAPRAERQKHPNEAAMARKRQADLERAASPEIAGAARLHGQLTAPVAGTVVRSWGEATEGGPALGISYRTPRAARVVSLCAGRVAFAAPFRSYGLLVIVDCGGGYHAVLAGFDKLGVKVGQQIAAGEPVGVMPDWQPGEAGTRPTLYVELRRDGQPVNPAPWLRASG